MKNRLITGLLAATAIAISIAISVTIDINITLDINQLYRDWTELKAQPP